MTDICVINDGLLLANFLLSSFACLNSPKKPEIDALLTFSQVQVKQDHFSLASAAFRNDTLHTSECRPRVQSRPSKGQAGRKYYSDHLKKQQLSGNDSGDMN